MKWSRSLKWTSEYKWSEYQWLVGGLLGSLLWISGSNWVSYRNSMQLIDSNQQVLKSYEIIQHLTTVYADMTVAESARRGYVLLDDSSEKERYGAGIEHLGTELIKLRQRLNFDAEQTLRLDRMEVLIRDRIALLERSLKLYKIDKTKVAEQRDITWSSVQLRTQIQALLVEMQQVEESRLRQWLQESQAHIRDRVLIEAWWLVSAFGIVSLGVYLVQQQLTQRKKSEAQREKLLQQKDRDALKLQFFSMASHEFRTPLSVILGSSQLLLTSDQSGDRDKVRKNTLRIQSSAKAMTQLLNDILTLARAEAGSLMCQSDRLELTSFCLNLVEDIDLANAHRHVIQFISRSTQQYANLDEKLLYLILSNLLLNAIKYSPIQSEIQLILEDQFDDASQSKGTTDNVTGSIAGGIIFKVQDQGQGISPTDIPHLYTPFYRGQNVGAIAGTGLGLAVVKTCVDLHHGTITIASNPDQGTTFTFYIPPQPEETLHNNMI